MKNRVINFYQNGVGKVGWVILNILVIQGTVFAQGDVSVVTPTSINNPIGSASFADFLESILNIVIEIGVPVLVIAIIWVGFKFVMAQGKPAELEKAKSAFFWVIIGSAIIIGCKVIVEIITSTVDTL